MVRRSISVLLLTAVMAITVSGAATPEALLDLGLRAFRAGDYQSAVVDLQAAAQGFLSPAQMETYVNTGQFEQLRQFETALVYLALAQFRLGREDDARETILRLVSAERISPTYANLPLQAEAAEFETLVAALVPSATLPRNASLAAADPSRPLPAVRPATEEKVAVRKTLAQERADRQAAVDEFIAKERERIQREADARIAAERIVSEQAAAEKIAAANREAEQRIAAAQAQANERLTEVQASTQERVTAAQTDAERRVAAAQAEAERRVAAAQAEAQQRIAAAEAEAKQKSASADEEAKRQTAARIAEIEQQTQERIAAARAQSEQAATQRISEAESSARRVYLTSLRQAEAFASNALVDDANEIYSRLANSENVPREVVAEAAVGLYRTGAFRESVRAFGRLSTFQRGEEDLRYYHAVALYEIGEYAAAQKELACALPFIQITDEVTRYRTKIEQTAAQQAARK
ncbi:MAG TPA: hypothetical protein VEK11_20565 [Thermoanaerobaculia bacterium]|nr:hypothetical protein [Thermoanaerobaculia bacterium]